MIKVFISHTFDEENKELAIKLQQSLIKSGVDGYLAEKQKEYDLLIRDKIKSEIERSDHLIAIITNSSKNSASVNQELGYALREGINPIIMLEKNSIQGVLTMGIESEEFTMDSFNDACISVLNHIVKKGTRKKFQNPPDENKVDLSVQRTIENLKKIALLSANATSVQMEAVRNLGELGPDAIDALTEIVSYRGTVTSIQLEAIRLIKKLSNKH
jgi:hypothetical protein